MSTWTPASHQHKVLFCGIVGAILARSIFIVAGLALLEAIRWTMYLFGAFFLGTGRWMMIKKQEQYNPERNLLIRFVRRRLADGSAYRPLAGNLVANARRCDLARRARRP